MAANCTSTLWAESVNSLQARVASASMARADIQTVTDQEFVLRCGRQLRAQTHQCCEMHKCPVCGKWNNQVRDFVQTDEVRYTYESPFSRNDAYALFRHAEGLNSNTDRIQPRQRHRLRWYKRQTIWAI